MNETTVVAGIEAAKVRQGEPDAITSFIGFRLPQEIADKLRAVAASEDRSVSSWLRLTILRALQIPGADAAGVS